MELGFALIALLEICSAITPDAITQLTNPDNNATVIVDFIRKVRQFGKLAVNEGAGIGYPLVEVDDVGKLKHRAIAQIQQKLTER